VFTPNFCINSLAWYSWMFIRGIPEKFSVDDEDACEPAKRLDRFLGHKLRCSSRLVFLVMPAPASQTTPLPLLP
jgi:hypothetical protein